MPFTFSHPAIVLPLTWLPPKWFSLTGLVVGSVTPDFEYFIRMTDKSQFSHTIGGLFWFDLPLAILLAFIYHNMVRDSLLNNLPVILKSRLFLFKEYDWNKDFKKNWFVIIISILIGAASHLFWDDFTHPQAYFVEAIPVLTNKIEIAGRQIEVYWILQHVSTVIGGLVVAFALLQLKADKTVTGQISFTYWSIIVCLTLAIIAARLLAGLAYKLSWDLVMTIISAGLISLILTPLLIRSRHNQP